jgi:hypothetical protein
VLSPERIDDYTEKKPVRFIYASVDSLSLKKLGFTHPLDPTDKGKPSCDPVDYVYGYLYQVRSSGKVERE